MTHATIPLIEWCGNSLDTRSAATELFIRIKSYCSLCGDIEVDFSGVSFMSRSFADQFHKEKMEWHNECNMVIITTNATAEIIELFKAVSNTQVKRSNRPSSIDLYSFSNMESLFRFLEKN